MKAVVLYDKGDRCVELRDVPVPAIGPEECLVEVKYCGICGSEPHMYHGQLTLLARPPVVLGHEWSGEVVQVGERVEGFAVGDRVTCETAAETCGVCALCRSGAYNVCPERRAFGFAVDGAFTQYVKARYQRLHHLPQGVGYETSAMTEPICVAYNAVAEKSHVNPGDTVVVIGPGPVGLFALQVARLAGAGTLIVTGTPRDRKRLELARKLGADLALDVTEQDPAEVLRGIGDGLGAHLVIDCAGVPPAIKQSLELVRRNGQVTKVGWSLQPVNLTMDEIVAKVITYQGAFSHTWTTWETCLELMRQKKIETEALVSEIWPITRWQEAFEKLEALEAHKILLFPV
ncbi:MAG: alcohol dehydrogenase catalytic domain-containing protein [Anaerolineaceae bacterium]|nr:alcohol dehydrogenase catalytic domain-containing protein [Anaerolineaceae bacterium]